MEKENRDTFLARFVFLPRADYLDVALAYDLAKAWFRSKYRKEKDEFGNEIRYFEHLRRVALILIDELHISDPKIIIAGILHDAIEDTRADDYAAEQIERRFGADVVQMVKLLSKVPKLGYKERLLNFGDWRVLMLKGADRLDNLRSLHAGSEAFQRKQIDETRVEYYPVFDRMVSLAPTIHIADIAMLRDNIRWIADHFEFGV